MGWTPYEYYTATPYEFFAACEGFLAKEEKQAQMLRIASYRIHQSLLGRKEQLKIDEYWPLFSDGQQQIERVEIQPLTQEEYEAIKKRHMVN